MEEEKGPQAVTPMEATWHQVPLQAQQKSLCCRLGGAFYHPFYISLFSRSIRKHTELRKSKTFI